MDLLDEFVIDEVMMELDIYFYLEVKNMISFTTGFFFSILFVYIIQITQTKGRSFHNKVTANKITRYNIWSSIYLKVNYVHLRNIT